MTRKRHWRGFLRTAVGSRILVGTLWWLVGLRFPAVSSMNGGGTISSAVLETMEEKLALSNFMSGCRRATLSLLPVGEESACRSSCRYG